MLQSSAYRTKRWPRRSNSRSSSSSTRLLSSGESGPPCGVPSTLGPTNPFSITPAFRNARMSFNSRLSSTRLAIHIHQGKGSRDRDVPMTPKLLEALREYFRWKSPKVYFFPSTEGHRGVEEPLSDHTIWYICSEAAKRAGIKKRVGAHTLRHSFATTLMEAGTDLRTIQLLMGHAHLEHTMVYLHLSQRHLHAASNPLDQITVGSQSASRKRPDNYPS